MPTGASRGGWRCPSAKERGRLAWPGGTILAGPPTSLQLRRSQRESPSRRWRGFQCRLMRRL